MLESRGAGESPNPMWTPVRMPGLALLLCLAGCGLQPPENPPRPSYVPSVDREKLLELLGEGDYERLESTLAGLQNRFQEHIEAELDLEVAFRTFWTGDPKTTGLLDRWLDERPESAYAHLARARHLERLGYLARGGATAGQTSRDQFDAMAELHSQAVYEATTALELDSRLTEAWVVLMGVAQGQGDQPGCRRAAEAALAIAPASYRIRRAYLECLLPRWGGTSGAMSAFITDSLKHARDNPRLWALGGCPAWDRGRGAQLADRLESAVKLFTRALEYGDDWRFYADRGWTYYRQDRLLLALGDLNRALELLPQHPESLVDRAFTLERLGRYEEALEDVARVRKLDPTENRLDGAAERVVAGAVSAAWERFQGGEPYLALALYGRVVEAQPDAAAAYYWRGRVLLELGHERRARADLEKAGRLDPDEYGRAVAGAPVQR